MSVAGFDEKEKADTLMGKCVLQAYGERCTEVCQPTMILGLFEQVSS